MQSPVALLNHFCIIMKKVKTSLPVREFDENSADTLVAQMGYDSVETSVTKII